MWPFNLSSAEFLVAIDNSTGDCSIVDGILELNGIVSQISPSPYAGGSGRQSPLRLAGGPSPYAGGFYMENSQSDKAEVERVSRMLLGIPETSGSPSYAGGSGRQSPRNVAGASPYAGGSGRQSPPTFAGDPDFVLGNIEVYLINGDLLDERTDAIVHCTDVHFSLKGAISRCLTRKIGAAFVTEEMVFAMIIDHYTVSTSYNLACKYILHLDVISELSRPEKILKTCLDAADRHKMVSVSLPQLAMNGKSVPLDEMASAIVQVMATLKTKYLRRVNIVLYEADMVSILKKAIVDAKSGVVILKLTTLKSNDAEYQSVSKEFLSSLKRTATIVSIEKITNKTLKKQYELQLSKINILHSRRKNERILWHGTKADVVVEICKNGFDRGYCGTNGTWHGQGVYFATQSEYSDQDTYTPRDNNGCKHMFMCRVATGLYVQGQPNMKVLPARPSGQPPYNSAVNRPEAPTVFIIFNDVQAYPAYHITYK